MKKQFKLKGQWATKKIWLNGKLLSPLKSLAIRKHSPDGFNWGYGGSGPAQLALALCIELIGVTLKDAKVLGLPFNYQKFKFDFVGTLPQADFSGEYEVEIETKVLDNE